MKKFIYISLIIILFISIFFVVVFRLIPQSNIYSVTNEDGKALDVSIYLRKNGGYDELILIFNDIETKNVIIIDPNFKLIGLSEGGRKEFIKVSFTSSLYQKSKRADKYMVINNLVNNLIKTNTFSKNKIEFDTFWEYEQLGKTIVITW